MQTIGGVTNISGRGNFSFNTSFLMNCVDLLHIQPGEQDDGTKSPPSKISNLKLKWLRLPLPCLVGARRQFFKSQTADRV